MKKTIIIGASSNPERYSNMAAKRLIAKGHEIINIGVKSGEVAGVPIEKAKTIYNDIDTITLYVKPQHQNDYFDYILKTKPKRIIFNPGTENAELKAVAEKHGIQTTDACTLVLLSIGMY
ncbi:MAG: CoA-binding protein [Flavobacterium sp.]|nr:CoA-binding protein [Pedobacter sp.]